MKKEQGIKYILLSIIRKDMSSTINVNGTPSDQTSFECRSVKEETLMRNHHYPIKTLCGTH